MTRIVHRILLAGLALPAVAHAGLPPKDLTGGISLSAWFSPEDYDAVGAQPSDEASYCELFQETSNRLWVTTEGQHYIKHVSFMMGKSQPGVRFHPGTGRAVALYGSRIAFPHVLPLDLDEYADTMNHEMGHYFYGLPDEYLEVSKSGIGFCADDPDTDPLMNGCTSVGGSTCVSGAECIVKDGCHGGTHDGKVCVDIPGLPDNYLGVDRADCAAGGGSCYEPDPGVCLAGTDIGDPCTSHADCGGAPEGCSAKLTDMTVGIDLVGFPSVASCAMAATSRVRWCAENHLHELAPIAGLSNPMSLDQSLSIWPHVVNGAFAQADDYNCWAVAEANYADLSWPGAYSFESDLGAPPPTSCTWSIDEIELTGSTALVVDTSGSMMEDDAWRSAVDGAEYLNTKALADPDQLNVGLYHFDSEFHPLPHASLSLGMGPAQDLGDGVDRDALDAYMDPNKKTHICEALAEAESELGSVPVTDRKIVLLTDGVDTSPAVCDPVSVAADLCANGISVHALAYGAADVAATQAMTQAGCGEMMFAPPGFLGLSSVHALQLGLARIGSRVEGDLEVLYRRRAVAAGVFGDVVDEVLTVPERTESLTLTWMGNDAEWAGESVFNQLDTFVTSPSGSVWSVPGGQHEDRARFRSLVIEDPEPGVWWMTVDATTAPISVPVDVEVGWLATITAPVYDAEAWTPHPRGVLGQPVPIRATATLLTEGLARMVVDAEVVFDETRWPMALYDDGLHGDDGPGDGVYGGSFLPTEVGPHAVEVTFAVDGGTSHSVPSGFEVEDSFLLRADTAFQVMPDEPLLGVDVNGGPIDLPDLIQGGVHVGLHTTLFGAPLSEANTVLSLGDGIELTHVVMDCLTCGLSDANAYELWFDAVVDADAELGPRDLTVQVAATQYRLEDATEVLPAPSATAFGVGALVVTEVRMGEWFEIHNPSSAPVDLYGLEVQDRSGERFRIQHPLAVPAGGYVALSPAAYGGMSLDSGADEILLVSGRTTVDAVGWDASWPIVAGQSMSLAPGSSARDNDDPSSWCSGGDPGTPGAANAACGKGR